MMELLYGNNEAIACINAISRSHDYAKDVVINIQMAWKIIIWKYLMTGICISVLSD